MTTRLSQRPVSGKFAYVIRNWTYRTDSLDLSDHYPLAVQFRLTAVEEASRLTLHPGAGGLWQLASMGAIGRKYELQYSPDLRVWEPLEVFQVINSTHLFTEPASPTSSRFYRLRLLED